MITLNDSELSPPFIELNKFWAIELPVDRKTNFVGILFHITCGRRCEALFKSNSLWEGKYCPNCKIDYPDTAIKLYLLSDLGIKI